MTVPSLPLTTVKTLLALLLAGSCCTREEAVVLRDLEIVLRIGRAEALSAKSLDDSEPTLLILRGVYTCPLFERRFLGGQVLRC